MKLKKGEQGLKFILIVLGIASFLHAGNSQIEVEKRINFISSALEKSMQETYQGQGVAKVSIYREFIPEGKSMIGRDGKIVEIKPRGTELETERKEFLVEFAFKNKSSRADTYELKNGQRDKHIDTYITTPENEIQYYSEREGRVSIDVKKERFFYRRIGKDFHPEALITNFRGGFLPELMKKYFDIYREVSIDNENDRLIQIDAHGQKNNKESFLSLLLVMDSQAIFRPVRFSYNYQNDQVGTVLSEDYHAEWKQYLSSWYIKTLIYGRKEKISKEKFPTKFEIEIEIEKFTPTEVKDMMFSFEGLNLPPGTKIYDRIAEISYTIP